MTVQLINHMGNDLSVVNAARVSFDKESKEFSEQDAKLVHYLARHNHWSPFAHAFLSFRIKAPIFVARQLVKHQVGLAWNEVSRRYVSDTPEFYMPNEFHYKPDGSIKQGSSPTVHDDNDTIRSLVAGQAVRSLTLYNHLIDSGVSPEEARMVLPLSSMTEWIWSGSLYAFARVCKLRLDSHAQKATREVAAGIDTIANDLFPVSWEALLHYADKPTEG